MADELEFTPDPLGPLVAKKDPATGTVTITHQAGVPQKTLPWWWGLTYDDSGAINYGDIHTPVSGAIAPDRYLPVCYGAVRIGGTEIKLEARTGDPFSAGWGVIAWCEGEIEAVDAILQGGLPRTSHTDGFGSVLAFTHYTGAIGQYRQDNTSDIFCPFPRTNPGVGSNGPYETTGLGTAAYTRLDSTPSVFHGQMFWWIFSEDRSLAAPMFDWAADVRGLKIYDPRTTLTAYSNNPALIVHDLLTRYGGRTIATLDEASFIAAANACDTAGFTCNVAFAAQTDIKNALAIVLQTCNGVLVPSNGKLGLFLDVVNAGAAVATLSEADGDVWGLSYEWISARDRITQVVVNFYNSAADYILDATPPFEDPGVKLGTVPLKPLAVTAPGVNTLAAAVILRDYIFNAQAVTFRVVGTMNASGILISQGNKITLTTLKGISADFIIQQITGDGQGFFNFVAKPYLAAVYGTTPITQNPPVTNPPGANPDAPPPPAAVRHQMPIVPVGVVPGVAFDAPRVYAPSGPYGVADWTISGSGASGDTAKINDGNTTVVAVTSTSAMVLHLDRGIAVPQVFGRLDFWIDASLADFFQYGLFEINWSDDDLNWFNALQSFSGYHNTTPWQDDPVGGIYPCHIEIPDSIGAHRYWQIGFFGIAAGLGTLNLYEAAWSTFTAYAGVVSGYQIRTWPGGTYNAAFPQDLNDYSTPRADTPVIFTLGTLPTDGSPFLPVDVAGLFEVVGDDFSTQAGTFRAAFVSVGLATSVNAVPGSAREVLAPVSTIVNSVNGISGNVTLVAGTNMTITPGVPGANDITLDAAGGGGGGGTDLTFLLMGA